MLKSLLALLSASLPKAILHFEDKNVVTIIIELQELPGDSRRVTKYHSNQYVSCWKQWRTDELVDVLCPSGAYEKVFWWVLDLSQFDSN